MKKLLAAAAALVLAGPLSAQSSTYYLTDGDASKGFIVQNGVLQSTFTISYQNGYPMYPLYVNSGGLLIGNRSGSSSIGYNLNGTTNGVNNALSQSSVDQLLDGGTDGTYTYTARCCSQADGIYRGGMDFDNQQYFAGRGQFWGGVTYGAGSVWGLNGLGALVQFDMAGNQLNSWTIGTDRSALAFEESTNSLWLLDRSAGAVVNYDLSGNMLSSTAVAGLNGNIWGGEMMFTGGTTSVVPEPSTYALMGAGLLAVGFVSRRRRKA